MRNSLIFKLMGAFLLIVAIGALVISLITSQATRNAFNLYSTRSGQFWAQRLAPSLAEVYSRANNWQGVDREFLSNLGAQITPGMGMGMTMGMGQGAGQGRGPGAGRVLTPSSSGSVMAMMDQRLVLADARGLVVSDTQGELEGIQLSNDDLKNGAGINAGGQVVGTILVLPGGMVGAGTPAGDFLSSVNQAILVSVAIAGIIALVLGAALFLQITAPLRKLQKAAGAIAMGDLNQRVDIRSKDELGELGQAFNRMADSLAASETQRRHLVADVAHELRTPLAAIQGTLEGMQDGVLPLDEEQLAVLYAETMLLNRLVGDLKLLSLAEAGQLKLEKQEIHPGALLQQIAERARPKADASHIRLEMDLPPDLPVVWIDADRITQVLNNLIGNALRYTPEGGAITLQAKAIPAECIIQISVSDSGPGIDPQDLPHIFDRFYRADKSRARLSGGSGLGLAIVRQLVEAHGGRVWAESPAWPDAQPGNYGARILFTLPLA